MKRSLIILCLLLLLASPVMAQTPNVGAFLSAGIAVDMSGNGTDIQYVGVMTMLSARAYIVGEGSASKALDIGSGSGDYGVGSTVGYIFNNYVTATAGIWLNKTENGDASPWYSKAGAAISFFPKADLLKPTGDKWGLTAAVQYKPGTKQLFIAGMLTTMFGK